MPIRTTGVMLALIACVAGSSVFAQDAIEVRHASFEKAYKNAVIFFCIDRKEVPGVYRNDAYELSDAQRGTPASMSGMIISAYKDKALFLVSSGCLTKVETSMTDAGLDLSEFTFTGR